MEQNDPQDSTAQRHVGEFWTQEREGIDGMPPWRDLSASERETVTAAYQEATRDGNAQWQAMVNTSADVIDDAGKVTTKRKKIAGKIVGKSDAAVQKLRSALLNAG